MSSPCEICGGIGFTYEGEERKKCVCRVKHRAQLYLRNLLPLTPVPHVATRLDKATHEGNLLIQVPNLILDQKSIRWMFGYLLLRGGITRSYQCMNAYDLIQITFREHEKISSLGRIGEDILCLYYGFFEGRNSLQGDLILQLLEMRASKGKQNWVLVRGNPPYGRDIEDYALDRDYEVIDFRKPAGAGGIRTRDPKPPVDARTETPQGDPPQKSEPSRGLNLSMYNLGD